MSTRFSSVPWLQGANIYEVNVRQYTAEGTFNAFAKHLPRLREMGVRILWFMPVTPISLLQRKGSLGSYYACSSYTDINPEFGTKGDFKALVDEAHELGFKVIIDWVANHTGWDHKWTQNPDWYRKDAQGNFIEIHGWDDVIDLNYDSEEMQSAMINAMKYWIGNFDLDGFRCDMAHLVALPFWSRARKECEAIKRLLWLGECDEDNYSEVFDITYSWRWMHATEAVAKDPGAVVAVKSAADNYLALPPGAQKLYFTANHDENSWNGTEYEKYGDLLAHDLAAMSSLFPGVPLIYSGQELPNQKRLKFFDKDQIEWDASGQPELAGFYKTLLTAHEVYAELFDGSARFQWLEDPQNPALMAYFLESQSQTQTGLCLINTNNHAQMTISLNNQLSVDQLAGKFINIWDKTEMEIAPDQQFNLNPGSMQAYFRIK